MCTVQMYYSYLCGQPGHNNNYILAYQVIVHFRIISYRGRERGKGGKAYQSVKLHRLIGCGAILVLRGILPDPEMEVILELL